MDRVILELNRMGTWDDWMINRRGGGIELVHDRVKRRAWFVVLFTASQQMLSVLGLPE